MTKKVWVVEDWNSGDKVVFESKEKAREYIRRYWVSNFREIYTGADSVDSLLDNIQEDLQNLNDDEPFIDCVMSMSQANYFTDN